MHHRKTNSRKKAFASKHSRQRKEPTRKPQPPRYSSLNARQKFTYERVSSFLSDLRAGRGSGPELLREYHLDRRTARKYAGRDLLGGTHGKPLRASKSDKRVRDMLFPTPYGDVPIRTRSSRDATKLSEFFNDRNKLLAEKMTAEKFETKWQNVRVAGKELFADVSGIHEMENADVLKVQDLYASTTGPR